MKNKDLILKILDKTLKEINNLSKNKDKQGLCDIIEDIIIFCNDNPLYEKFGKVSDLRSEVIKIIEDVNNVKFNLNSFYWLDYVKETCSMKNWYEPRIEAINKTIDYINESNLNT